MIKLKILERVIQAGKQHNELNDNSNVEVCVISDGGTWHFPNPAIGINEHGTLELSVERSDDMISLKQAQNWLRMMASNYFSTKETNLGYAVTVNTKKMVADFTKAMK